MCDSTVTQHGFPKQTNLTNTAFLDLVAHISMRSERPEIEMDANLISMYCSPNGSSGLSLLRKQRGDSGDQERQDRRRNRNYIRLFRERREKSRVVK